MMHAPPPNPTHNYWVTNMVSSSTTTMSPTGFSSEGEEAEETPTSSIGPPRKKIKHMDSKYQSEWSHKYSMKRSGRGETFAYCSVYNVDFSVAGGGVFQVKRYCQSKKHRVEQRN